MLSRKKIPFPFIGEALSSRDPIVKPMFGCHAYYIGEKIMVILRDKDDHTESNGIWIATSKEHHTSLRKLFPGLSSILILSNGKNETDWQMIRKEDERFETLAIRICELILRNDPRIGRVPRSKKKKKE